MPALETLDAACVKAGRDPATLQRTVTVLVDLPGSESDPSKGGFSKFFAFPRTPATGTSEQLAELLRGFARAGVGHVQIFMAPLTKTAIDAFSPVLKILDRAHAGWAGSRQGRGKEVRPSSGANRRGSCEGAAATG